MGIKKRKIVKKREVTTNPWDILSLVWALYTCLTLWLSHLYTLTISPESMVTPGLTYIPFTCYYLSVGFFPQTCILWNTTIFLISLSLPHSFSFLLSSLRSLFLQISQVYQQSPYGLQSRNNRNWISLRAPTSLWLRSKTTNTSKKKKKTWCFPTENIVEKMVGNGNFFRRKFLMVEENLYNDRFDFTNLSKLGPL